MSGVNPEWVEDIPGELGNRLTPLGELEWIFTAMMDSIAWSTLPLPLFRKLFRRDLLVAKLFRNFLLADRILRFVYLFICLLLCVSCCCVVVCDFIYLLILFLARQRVVWWYRRLRLIKCFYCCRFGKAAVQQ